MAQRQRSRQAPIASRSNQEARPCEEQRPRNDGEGRRRPQWYALGRRPRGPIPAYHALHKRPYQKSTHGGVDELGAFTQIGAFRVTGEWVFGQRTQCGMMAAPYGRGFPAMAADGSCVPQLDHAILDTEVRLCTPIRVVSAHLAGSVLHQSPVD